MSNCAVSERPRLNLRLDPEVWEQIDEERMKRAGNISRNTWICEAILEKLAAEQGRRMSSNA